MHAVNQAIQKLPADHARYRTNPSSFRVSTLSSNQFGAFCSTGHLPLESINGFVVYSPRYHEIALDDFYLAKRLKRAIIRNAFSVSTNQAFHQILGLVTQRQTAHPLTEDIWLRQKAWQALADLHEDGHAHSIEIYRHKELAGGVIGIHAHGFCLTLSGFSQGQGAGMTALLVAQAIVCLQGYSMHDLVSPTYASRLLGGQLVTARRDHIHRIHAFTVQGTAVFPTLDVNFFGTRLPVEAYLEPLLTKEDAHGRPFPCQERDASEEQDRSETLEDLWETRARNRRLRQARDARPRP